MAFLEVVRAPSRCQHALDGVRAHTLSLQPHDTSNPKDSRRFQSRAMTSGGNTPVFTASPQARRGSCVETLHLKQSAAQVMAVWSRCHSNLTGLSVLDRTPVSFTLFSAVFQASEELRALRHDGPAGQREKPGATDTFKGRS